MKENWHHWHPIANLASKYVIESIDKSPGEFKVSLYEDSHEDNKLLLIFENSVIAYRSVYETFRNQLVVDLINAFQKEFHSQCTFFNVENSEYIKSLNNEIPRNDLVHYLLLSDDRVLDIISNKKPLVTNGKDI